MPEQDTAVSLIIWGNLGMSWSLGPGLGVREGRQRWREKRWASEKDGEKVITGLAFPASLLHETMSVSPLLVHVPCDLGGTDPTRWFQARSCDPGLVN